MKITLKNTAPSALKTDLLVIPANSKQKTKRPGAKKALSKIAGDSVALSERVSSAFSALLKDLDKGVRKSIEDSLQSQEYNPAFGKRVDINGTADSNIASVRVSGLSNLDLAKPNALDEWRRLGGDVTQTMKRLRAKTAIIALSHVAEVDLERVVHAVSEGLLLGTYEFTRYKAKKKDAKPSNFSVELLVDGRISVLLKKALARAQAYAPAVMFSRDLVNTPPTDMNPVELTRQARKLSSGSKGRVKIKLFNRKALERLKAFSLLGVAKGSSIEPFLLHLQYQPKKRNKQSKKVILIGKGITFDSGGLSIKSGKGMEEMKCDMAGAACVLGVLKALTLLPKEQLPEHEIHVLVPTAENMINGDSLKPGDVISAINGKTIEVLNTDAEGRLILADALSYAERIKGDMIIDLATLTGACVVALGGEYAGLFSNDQKLTERLKAAGSEAGEKSWELPLAAEYRAQMESEVADLKNIGNGGPGAILGALFLKEFVPADTPWAHLDIAGPAFGGRSNEYIRRGATGYGVLTLLRMLENL